MSQWNIESPTTEYYDHQTPGLEAVIKEVLDTPEVAIDTETTGLVTWKDIPLYWSLAFGNRRMTLNVSALHKFRECFADPTKRWLFANAKFDVHMLANVGVSFAGKLIDTTVMHALLYEERSHGLKDMNLHLFGWQWQDFQDTFGKITKLNTPEMIIRTAEATNFPLLCEYAANDAWGTLQVYRELARQLKGAPTHSLFRHAPLYIETLWDLFDKIEVPYTKVLWHTERNGVLVNQEYLHSISPTAVAEIEDLSKEICKQAGKVINPNSTSQLSEYFFKQMGYTPMKMTKGGKSGIRKPSLDESSLEHFEEKGDKMAAMVLRYRSLSKLHGTYIVGLGEKMDPRYRIHTRFNQDVARTGRLSSSDPNMQNIPKPENDKWKLRGAFVAQEGYELIVADYEQLEMRLLACASLEPGMIDVIRKGWDIHMGNASMIFGMPYEEIKAAKAKEKKSGLDSLTPREKECVLARGAAKDIGFGLIYGMGPEKLANSIGVSRPEAEAKIKQFKEAYPAVNAFTIEAVRETEETGYAFTILGRRRNVPEIASHSRVERMRGERIAINCVDYKTEALTQRGWLKGSEVSTEDYLLAYSIDKNALCWERVSDVRQFLDYSGPMVSIESKTFSAKTTPNHRWAVFNKATGKLECKLTSELSLWGDHRIIRAAQYVLGDHPVSYRSNPPLSQHNQDHLKLIGWFLTDGSICQKKKSTHSQRVVLCQSQRANSEKVQQIDALIQRLGIKTSRYVNRSECVYWYFTGQLAEALVTLFPDRTLTHGFVASLDSDAARVLLEIMMLGDGSYYDLQNLSTFCCRSQEAADAFQALAAVAGKATTVRYRDMSQYQPQSSKLENIPNSNGCFYITLLNRDRVQIQRSQVTETEEACPVWCPVIPSTYFMARRHGKVYVTGNTQIQGSAADVVKMAQILLFKSGIDKRFGAFANLQVHDEIMHECPKETSEFAKAEIKDWMEHPFPIDLAVPLSTSINKGHSWLEAK